MYNALIYTHRRPSRQPEHASDRITLSPVKSTIGALDYINRLPVRASGVAGADLRDMAIILLA